MVMNPNKRANTTCNSAAGSIASLTLKPKRLTTLCQSFYKRLPCDRVTDAINLESLKAGDSFDILKGEVPTVRRSRKAIIAPTDRGL